MVFGIRVVVSKEKDGITKKEIKINSKNRTHKKANNIVLSIDHNHQIAKYNKECERILGYSKKEAINKQIFDFLIPKNFVKKWKNIINYSSKNKKIDVAGTADGLFTKPSILLTFSIHTCYRTQL